MTFLYILRLSRRVSEAENKLLEHEEVLLKITRTVSGESKEIKESIAQINLSIQDISQKVVHLKKATEVTEAAVKDQKEKLTFESILSTDKMKDFLAESLNMFGGIEKQLSNNKQKSANSHAIISKITDTHKNNELSTSITAKLPPNNSKINPTASTKIVSKTKSSPSKAKVMPSTMTKKGASILGMDTVLLIICAKRPDYLKQTLEAILKYHPRDAIPVLISEDGEDDDVADVIEAAKKTMATVAKTVPVIHVHHPDYDQPAENGYFRLARHFKWALMQVFSRPLAAGLPVVRRVIILEEDLAIAPDFYEMFAAMMPLLDSDPSLLAASAWNDNGQPRLAKDPEQLYRSDFFPGLGWMMTRSIWEELAPKWPKAYWDDWLREPKQRKDRHILRPEICRTYHFGMHGVSNAQYSEYMMSIHLNDKFIPFTTMNLTYLELNSWNHIYVDKINRLPVVTSRTFSCPYNNNQKEMRVIYRQLNAAGSGDSFEDLAHWSGAMDNIKAGVPRTAYHGIVTVWRGDCKVHIVPSR